MKRSQQVDDKTVTSWLKFNKIAEGDNNQSLNGVLEQLQSANQENQENQELEVFTAKCSPSRIGSTSFSC